MGRSWRTRLGERARLVVACCYISLPTNSPPETTGSRVTFVRAADKGRFMRLLSPLTLTCVTVALLGATGTAAAQAQGTANGEWPTYGGNLSHNRYSPLDQITAENFNELELAWRFNTDSFGPRPETNFESTPLMVNGVLYTTAGTRRAAVALDAADGRAALDASAQRGRAGRGSAAQTVRPRAHVLGRRWERRHSVCHARLPAGRPQCPDRCPDPELRRRGHRRPEAEHRPGSRTHLRNRAARGADRRRQHDHHRRGASAGWRAAVAHERQRLHPRLRSPDR